MAKLTPLQSRIAGQIISQARQSGWQPGHHLTEDSLLDTLGTSRTPIRAAMAWLESQNILEKRPNRGFFLRALPAANNKSAAEAQGSDVGAIYFNIAMERLKRKLPDSVSENELIRRFSVPRALLRIVLARIAAEGWIERKPGRGWNFLPLIDTHEAYFENYRFRQMLEPASIRSPEFRVDKPAVARLKSQQRAVQDKGYVTLTQVELFEINAHFHESLAAMGNNRFLTQAVVRVNQLRRLMEYVRPHDRERVRRVCAEHLAILDALDAEDCAEAACRLEIHLTDAAQEKSFSAPPDVIGEGGR